MCSEYSYCENEFDLCFYFITALYRQKGLKVISIIAIKVFIKDCYQYLLVFSEFCYWNMTLACSKPIVMTGT